jgi:hypothetical protein
MKNNIVFIVLLCMLMTFGLLVMPVAATENSTSATTDPTETTAPDLSTLVPDITFDGTNSSVTHGCRTLDAKYPLHGNENVLTYSQSALLYEVNSGTMLYNYNPDEPMYPSSLVKVMTALIAMEQGNLDDETIIVTHDSVRPFVTHRILDENIEAAKQYGACDTVIPATDTIVESLDNTRITDIPNRKFMYQGQTPQSFRAKRLKEIYGALTEEEKAVLTDACKILVLKGEHVHLVQGEEFNIKITYPYDLVVAKTLLGLEE